MKTPSIRLGLMLGLGCALSAPMRAQNGFNVDRRYAMIDRAVHLTGSERSAVVKILEAQADAIWNAKTDQEKMAINQAARAKIRAVLTDNQKVIWDATPQSQGGGMGRQDTSNLTAALQRAFHLSSSQASKAANIFDMERLAVASLPDGQRGQSSETRQIRLETNQAIRALLSPADQLRFDSVGDSVSDDLVDRVKIVEALRGSTVLATELGPIQTVKLKSSSVNSYSINGGPTIPGDGTYQVTVVGATKSEDFVVKASEKVFSSGINLDVTDIHGSRVSL